MKFYNRRRKHFTTVISSARNISGGATPVYTASYVAVLHAIATTDTSNLLDNTPVELHFQPPAAVCNTLAISNDGWAEFHNPITTVGANHDEPLTTHLPDGRYMDRTDHTCQQQPATAGNDQLRYIHTPFFH